MRPIDVSGDGGSSSDRGASTRHAYEELRDAIVTGALPAGTSLSQVKLAERLGISRTPLREAVRRLQQEGLLIFEPRRQVVVAPLQVKDLEELFGIRIVLESLAVRVSVPRLRAADIKALEQALTRLDRALDAGDHEAFIEPHRQFRMGLVSAAGPRTVGEVKALYDHAGRYRHLYLTTADEELALYRLTRLEYEQLFQAARHGDAAGAAWRLATHLARGASTAIAAIDPFYDAALIRSSLGHLAPSAEAVPAPV